MAITTVNIVVPSSGDGPAANVSALVGAKTVILAGTYQGSYTILGCHDGVTFVPLVTFSSDGKDPIVQTLPIAVLFVKVRSNATQTTNVTAMVSGVSGVGVNHFGILASVPPNFSGSLPIIDTSLLFPPTGLESDINIICAGSILGTILVEGSQDAVAFNPIGTFQAGQQSRPLLGLQPRLEFEPLPTEDKTRYIRITVQGQVFDVTTLTIGGSIPVIGPSSTTLSEAYDNGSSAADQTLDLTDAHGGGVVVDGTVVGFTGGNSLSVKSVAGFVNFPRLGGMSVDGNAIFNNDVGVNVAVPTARLHLAGVTATAGTASLKIDPGVLLTVTESGAVESNGTHLYWTDMGGTRWQLDGGGGGGPGTLAQTYAAGANAADQTMGLLDVRGGGVTVDATNVGFTGVVALTIKNVGGGAALFPSVGGLSVVSTVSVAAAAGSTWNEVDFQTSTLTLTGGPAVATRVSMVHVGQGIVNGVGNTVTDAYNQFVEAAPAGTATLTRVWSTGFVGAVQAQAGVVLGAGLTAPGENDLVVGDGATVVSEANSGRFGYIAGATQKFMVSVNGTAYVPILVGPSPTGFTPGAVPFGDADGSLTENSASFHWNNTTESLGVGTIPNAKLRVAGGPYTDTVGIRNNVLFTGDFSPTSGSAAYNSLELTYAITQTGGANGTVTGLKIIGGEISLVGAHNLIDAGVGVTRFRVTSAGTIQNTSGITLGLTLASPGENDIAMGAGGTIVSEANTGRIGYIAGATQKFVVSLNGGAYIPLLTTVTLAQAYTYGALAADQTLPLLDANGGGFVVDGTAAGFTGTNTLSVKGAASGTVLFPRVGGVSVASSVSTAAAPGSNWDEVSLLASTITLTGGPATVTALAMVHIGRGVVNGAGNTVTDAYNFSVDTFPSGTAALTRSWSAGFAGPVQARLGISLGNTVAPPGENDIAMGAGGTIVSEANTGRIGYIAGATQKFVVSQNGGAYVPLLTSATLAQAYGFGSVAADQTLALLDTKGGGLIVDGTNVAFTGAYALKILDSNVATSLDQVAVQITGTFAPTSGTATYEPINVAYTINQTGGANGTITGIKVTATETAVVGTHNLLDLRVGANSKFQVNNVGIVFHVDGTVGAPTIAWLTDPTTGEYHSGTGATGTISTAVNGVNVMNVNTFGLGVGAGALATSTFGFHSVGVGLFDNGIATDTIVGATGNSTTTQSLSVSGGSGIAFALQIRANKSVAAAAGTTWNGLNFLASTLTLTGGPATVTVVSMAHVNQGTINGAGNTVTDAYNQLVEAAPAGTATLSRTWSAGFVSAVQVQAGLVLGAAFNPPTENDLVFGAGATVVSEANSGRLGYRVATQNFAVSTNTGAYVPLLLGPAAGGFTTGSVPFGGATGQLIQDNANFFWDNTNKRLGIGTTPTATLHVVQPVVNAAVPTAFLLVSGAHTAITAGTEDIGVNFNLSATKTWATGAIATQREVVFQAPTYAFAAASTITTAATVVITDAPIAGAGPATLTNPYALWIQAGNVLMGPPNVASPANQAFTIVTSNTSGPTFLLTSTANDGGRLLLGSTDFGLVHDNFGDFVLFSALNVGTCISGNGATTKNAFVVTGNNNTIVGSSVASDVSSSRFQVFASKTVTAAAGANWNGINFAASTLTLSGATTPITSLTFFAVQAPTITAASAVVATDFFTCRIGAATFTGAGPASATRNWSLGIDGNTKFVGGQNIGFTDVNVAGPYAILATDYALEVRQTSTTAITLNLPSIATVGGGHVVISIDSGYNAAANNITLAPNGGDKINNVAGNYIQNVSGSAIWLKANTTTNNWEIF